MAYKRKTYKRKRTYRRRTRRRYPQARSTKAPVPTSYYTKLRYSESFNRTIGVGQTDTILFRANSLHAPSYTSGISGHQPRGYDQLMTLYNRYTVVGCKITITAAPNNPDGGDNNLIFGIAMRNSTGTITTNLVDYTEGRTVRSRMLSNGLSTEARTMTMNMNVGKYLTVSKILSNDKLGAKEGFNPETEAFFVVYSAAPTAPANEKIQFFVNLEFTAVFTKPKVLPLS